MGTKKKADPLELIERWHKCAAPMPMRDILDLAADEIRRLRATVEKLTSAAKVPMKTKLEQLRSLMIDGLRLVCTCGACPEQYDVFDGDTQVGYLRLRHGSFRADVPDCGGKTVYAAHTQGDGVFYDDERMHYLTEAVAAIQKARSKTT